MSIGFVYCMDNYQTMPGLYKIGHTLRSPAQRAKDLSSTGVPHPFSVVGYIEVNRPEDWERRFHRYLDKYRCNSGREFFKAPMSVIAPLFLLNEFAYSRVDCDFTPALYIECKAGVEVLANPYHQHPWLSADPV